ncbi:MAG: OmpA family protein [Gammaproteobacteria bacterium]|nr:OmpA family protein [Gammaproteobacteria bacterium]
MRRNLNRESENTDRWLVSYADFITLLFAFFVVMYSVSQVNDGKFRVLSETLNDAFVQPERSLQPIQIGEVNKADNITPGENIYPTDYLEAPATPETDKNFKELREGLDESLKELVDAGLIDIRSNHDWIEVNMGSGLLFQSGGDALSQNAIVTLSTIIETVNLKENNLALKIRGYTDNIPINSRRFPSNWALSSARAVAVIHQLESLGILPERMTSEGYGEHQPDQNNNSDAGRRANRRVVLAISRLPPVKSSLERKAIETANLLPDNEAENADAKTDTQGQPTDEPESNIVLIRSADGTLTIRNRDDVDQNTTNSPENNNN